ncbi:Hypothetical protein CpCap5W_0531 [Corynebacterium pseudotuberculosis]|uniref:Uncharacterized protein n=2 Tax=Corynebacterium pseudotuberculosis TaxID=1719 RepID=D9QES1_CORP2|nr:hypothetical protein CPC231_02540 [Corynebacterium pseudotuberculosis C231]ADL20397.2 hypothetical protein CP1002_02540 [Corynebacterium pseudotuberculosis 1002]ADO25786.2 hypothetical protein CPI19_02540 [Corynebacterium pseudotuberculosis I19]AEK91838.1 Hypothetical protein CpPAT10_0506 [Corynebacterium pseudotuberculosis PAT10]AEQ06065.1 hypothetical protein CPCIP5297_02685 [Corynebacterium pseudotuberculosis CIP 52.97]AFB71845.1 hypothetical protein CP316_02670 [Corynebacterium pseudotu
MMFTYASAYARKSRQLTTRHIDSQHTHAELAGYVQPYKKTMQRITYLKFNTPTQDVVNPKTVFPVQKMNFPSSQTSRVTSFTQHISRGRGSGVLDIVSLI